ncbi:peptidoglycan DD-metalloendopeptidase family protein [Paenibacillus gansuensis]|uniref:Peptidoglycan DD-metalloendopeptidase family protein n=1 Tax=Paenibacillus gansuensis TaxID=306542 RepID=A0ABW5PJV2_9BACL
MNNDKNQDKLQDQAPKTVEGAAVKGSGWKKLLGKKWVFPAAYMAAAAIILTLMWVYQGADNKPLKDMGLTTTGTQTETGTGTEDGGAVPVNAVAEPLGYPVADPTALEVSREFYNPEASNEEKQAMVVEYDNTYSYHMGIDYAAKDDQKFDVLAAMTGKVTRVELKHPLLGNLVEVTNAAGLKTVYQSLSDVAVKQDQEVKKGDVIAKAGRNELEKDLGVHVHFEVRDNDKPVNPESLLEAKTEKEDQ